jgi:glycosyltransferase involved in cell wall biosynthesis
MQAPAVAVSARPEPAALQGASIVSFAVDRWTDVPRCRHHVMSRLARRNRVLFTAPPWQLREAIFAGANGETGLARVADNLYTYAPPRWLPDSYRFPRFNRCSLRLRSRLLSRTLRRLGIDRPIVYIWHPLFADVIGELDEQLVVYHCYDEYSAFAGADRDGVADAEARILAAADLVFTVSEGLHARKSRFNPNTYLVRNAVDYRLFAAAQDAHTPIPGELGDIRRPIVGCVTRIVPEYFDAPLLRAIFAARPDWSFVVVGPECSASPALSDLKALPNVHLLGRRPFTDVPSYLKAFDACLIPYVLTENKRLADPLKLYEYLAAGKPVVSKPLASLTAFGDVVTFASGTGEWIAAIDEAVRGDSPDAIGRRQAVARHHTWDNRVELISQLIARALAA